jgi:hypothetical protein
MHATISEKHWSKLSLICSLFLMLLQCKGWYEDEFIAMILIIVSMAPSIEKVHVYNHLSIFLMLGNIFDLLNVIFIIIFYSMD